jgi:hypothetical protein
VLTKLTNVAAHALCSLNEYLKVWRKECLLPGGMVEWENIQLHPDY